MLSVTAGQNIMVQVFLNVNNAVKDMSYINAAETGIVQIANTGNHKNGLRLN
jgi:hypothetical protein